MFQSLGREFGIIFSLCCVSLLLNLYSALSTHSWRIPSAGPEGVFPHHAKARFIISRSSSQILNMTVTLLGLQTF